MPEPGDVFGYDTRSDRAVFVEVASPTWAFDRSTNTWQRRQPTGGPPPAHGARMAYDSESDRLITFGGDNFGPLSDDTWAYDYEADTWTKMAPSSRPSARSYYAMAYDAAGDRVVIFGGDGQAGETSAYDFDSDAWTQLASGDAGPGPRAYSAMAYDRQTERIILFGGVTGSQETPLDDTWAYDLGTDTWTELDAPGPGARGWHAMVADRETNTIVLFGGGASRGSCTAETWIFDPAVSTWSEAR